jgi:hypothetical protein
LPEQDRCERGDAHQHGSKRDIAEEALFAADFRHHMANAEGTAGPVVAILRATLDQKDVAGYRNEAVPFDVQRSGFADGRIIERRPVALGRAGEIEQQHGVAVVQAQDGGEGLRQLGGVRLRDRQGTKFQSDLVGQGRHGRCVLFAGEGVFSDEFGRRDVDAEVAPGHGQATHRGGYWKLDDMFENGLLVACGPDAHAGSSSISRKIYYFRLIEVERLKQPRRYSYHRKKGATVPGTFLFPEA